MRSIAVLCLLLIALASAADARHRHRRHHHVVRVAHVVSPPIPVPITRPIPVENRSEVTQALEKLELLTPASPYATLWANSQRWEGEPDLVIGRAQAPSPLIPWWYGFAILATLSLGFMFYIVVLNVSYYRTRRAMTPEERKKDDEETAIFQQQW